MAHSLSLSDSFPIPKSCGIKKEKLECLTCQSTELDEQEGLIKTLQERVEAFGRRFHEFNKAHMQMLCQLELHHEMQDYDEEWFSYWDKDFQKHVNEWKLKIHEISHTEDLLRRSLWAKDGIGTEFEKEVIYASNDEKKENYLRQLKKSIEQMEATYASIEEEIQKLAHSFWQMRLEIFENEINALLVIGKKIIMKDPKWKKIIDSAILFMSSIQETLSNKRGLTSLQQEEMANILSGFKEIRKGLEQIMEKRRCTFMDFIFKSQLSEKPQ